MQDFQEVSPFGGHLLALPLESLNLDLSSALGVLVGN